MAVFTKPAAEVFAPTEANGALRAADMGEAQTWGVEVEYLANLAYTSSLVYSTRAALYANLVPGANTPALVIGDPTAGYDGLYMKVGATTTGSWTRLGDVPGYSFIKATDAGAGTANAIVATSTPIPSADGGALIALNIFETNTATPVTVAFNGGSALTVKTNAGNNVAVGGLTAGMIVAGYKSGTTFRLLSDQASAAILAAAEAAQAAAEAAQVAAEAAAAQAAADAASIVPFRYNTQALAAAATISASTDFILVGDDVYQRVSATHPRLGPELMVNGDMSSATGWLESGGGTIWSIGAGIATAVVGAAGDGVLYRTVTLANGDKIFYSFNVLTVTADSVRAILTGSNTTGAANSTTGVKTGVLTATGASTGIGLYSSGAFAGTVDDYSAKKLPADAFQSADGAWWARTTGDMGVSLAATETAALARTALGLGSAALLTAGDASGNLKALNADGALTFATTTTSANVAGVNAGVWKTAHRFDSTDTATLAGNRTTMAILRGYTGSGENGPTRSDTALHLEAEQDNWLTTSVLGESDTLRIFNRKGANGDMAGILINVGKVESASYGSLAWEAASSWVTATTGAMVRLMRTSSGHQGPATDLRGGGMGFNSSAITGDHSIAFAALQDHTDTGQWKYPFLGADGYANGDEYFYVTGPAHASGMGKLYTSGIAHIAGGVAAPAGGSSAAVIQLSSLTGAIFGIYFGSAAPTVSAAKGSLYLRRDGTTTNNRAYINTDGGTTWTALTTAA